MNRQPATMAPRSDPIAALFATMPNQYDNPVGAQARSHILNHIKGHIPGTFPRDIWDGEWSAGTFQYRSWFCPNYSRWTHQSAIDDYWDRPAYWSDLAAAMLSQRIHHVTRQAGGLLNRDAINGHIQAASPSIGWWTFAVYAAVAADSDTYASVLRDARSVPNAKQRYRDALTSPNWINSRITAYEGGNWKQQTWELYHHWIKMHLLGATIAEARETVTTCIKKGLPVPNVLAWRDWPTWWPYHAPWFRTFDETALSDMDARIKASRYVVAGRYPQTINEFYSREWCRSGQPGSTWSR